MALDTDTAQAARHSDESRRCRLPTSSVLSLSYAARRRFATPNIVVEQMQKGDELAQARAGVGGIEQSRA